MRAILITIALLSAGTAQAQQSSWPGAMTDGFFEASKADAAKLQPGCVAELEHGAEGEACKIYRLTALKAINVAGMRVSWCLQQVSEASRPTPEVCKAQQGATDPTKAALVAVGWPRVEELSRKIYPELWAKVDAADGEIRR